MRRFRNIEHETLFSKRRAAPRPPTRESSQHVLEAIKAQQSIHTALSRATQNSSRMDDGDDAAPRWRSQTVGARMQGRPHVIDSHHGPQATKAYAEREGWPIGWTYRGNKPFVSEATPGPDGRLRTRQISTRRYMLEPEPKTADRLELMLAFKQEQLVQSNQAEEQRRNQADRAYHRAAEAAAAEPVPTRVPPPPKWGYCSSSSGATTITSSTTTSTTTNNNTATSTMDSDAAADPSTTWSRALRERKLFREFHATSIDERLTGALFLSLSGGATSMSTLREQGAQPAAVSSPLIPLALGSSQDQQKGTRPLPPPPPLPPPAEEASTTRSHRPRAGSAKKAGAGISGAGGKRGSGAGGGGAGSMRVALSSERHTSHGRSSSISSSSSSSPAPRRSRKLHVPPPRPLLPQYATSPTVRAELYRREIDRRMETLSGSAMVAATKLQAAHRRRAAAAHVEELRKAAEVACAKLRRSTAAKTIQARLRAQRDRRLQEEADVAARGAALAAKAELKANRNKGYKSASQLTEDELREGGGGIGGVCGKCGRLVCGCRA